MSVWAIALVLPALLVANFAVLFIATQVFSDLLVQLLLGLMAGFVLTTPTLAEHERTRWTVMRSGFTVSSPRPATATLRDPFARQR